MVSTSSEISTPTCKDLVLGKVHVGFVAIWFWAVIIAKDKRMNDLDLIRTKGSMHPRVDKPQVFSWHCVCVP